jgi:hypothetical protein
MATVAKTSIAISSFFAWVPKLLQSPLPTADLNVTTLTRRAEREQAPINWRHSLIICADGPSQVAHFNQETGCSTISVVDACSIPTEEAMATLAKAYQASLGLQLSSATWESPCYSLTFDKLVIHHYLCHPEQLKLNQVPNLVLVWRLRYGITHISQGWVRQLAKGSAILSDSSYPLLTEAEESKLNRDSGGGTAGCYVANSKLYDTYGYHIWDNSSMLGVLIRQ